MGEVGTDAGSGCMGYPVCPQTAPVQACSTKAARTSSGGTASQVSAGLGHVLVRCVPTGYPMRPFPAVC